MFQHKPICFNIINKTAAFLHQPGIEPGAPRWQREILPLNHWCFLLHDLGSIKDFILDCALQGFVLFAIWSLVQRASSPTTNKTTKRFHTFSICACHPCAGAMLIFSVSFQFYRMTAEAVPSMEANFWIYIALLHILWKSHARKSDTRTSNVVSHHRTNRARPCLTSEIGRDQVLSRWYGRLWWWFAVLPYINPWYFGNQYRSIRLRD